MSNSRINAAIKAMEYLEESMSVVLGSGSTVHEFIKLLSPKVKGGFSVECASTSFDTTMLSETLGIKITPFEYMSKVDLAVDGADVVAPTGLLKGGGGACTVEKIMDYSADKFIVIADNSKFKNKLGGIVVVEVLPVAYKSVMKKFKHSKLRMATRKLGPVITDNGNFLVDVEMEVIDNPKELENEINNMPGVVENGIFTKFDIVILGEEDGSKVISY